MTHFPPLLTLMAAVLCVSPCLGKETLAPVTADNLVRVESKQFDAIYVTEQVSETAYQAVFIQPPDVSFRKNWQRDQNRYLGNKVRAQDVARIKTEVADLLVEVLARELQSAGYTLAEAAGDGTLVLQANIIELDVIAPDTNTPNRSYQFSESAGRMTLDLTAMDGASQEPLMQLIDKKEDFREGWLEWRTRVSNRASARRMMTSWARSTLEAFDTYLKTTPNPRLTGETSKETA